MDSRIKSFEEYKASIQLQESKVGDIARKIKDVVVTALKKIGNFFEGVGSSFLNSLVKQEKNMLPKSVTIFPNDADLKALKEHGESIKVPPVSKVKLPPSVGAFKVKFLAPLPPVNLPCIETSNVVPLSLAELSPIVLAAVNLGR